MHDRYKVVVVFVLSRLAAMAAGVRFDADTIETHWQFLDARLLESDLVASVWNLHSQPPVLNALYGVLAKLSSADHGYALSWLLFVSIGLAAALALYELASRLGDRRIALLATCLFLLSPAAILFENVFFYPHLVMAGLCGAALALERALATDRWQWFVAVGGLAAAIALTRSTFHLGWVVLVCAVMIAVSSPASRRRVAIIAGVAVLIVTGWYAKNLIVVGKFTGSTWAGMSLAKSTSNALDNETYARIVRDGTVSQLYTIQPFSRLDRYSAFALPPADGHPALSAVSKANGTNNYNNFAYVQISDLYMRDALAVMRSEPASVLRGQGDSWSIYFQPTSQYHRFIATIFARGGYHRANIAALGTYERIWNTAEGLQFGEPPNDAELIRYSFREMRERRMSTVSWTSILGTVAIVVVLPLMLFRRWRSGALDARSAAVIAFCVGNILFVAFVGNAVEIGENQRFKFETEALWWAMLVVLASWGLEARSTRRARTDATPDSDASSSEAVPGD